MINDEIVMRFFFRWDLMNKWKKSLTFPATPSDNIYLLLQIVCQDRENHVSIFWWNLFYQITASRSRLIVRHCVYYVLYFYLIFATDQEYRLLLMSFTWLLTNPLWLLFTDWITKWSLVVFCSVFEIYWLFRDFYFSLQFYQK